MHQFFRIALAAFALQMAGSVVAQPSKVAIANFGEHPQLNAAVLGFKKGVMASAFVEGKTVEFVSSHTNFDIALVPQMLAKLQADRPKLMFAVTTPVSQVPKKMMQGTGVPVVFGAVTDPVAARLTSFWGAGSEGITGASDLQDVTAILDLARRLGQAQRA
jgi:putative ABC transport system substrate-binding protein